jgi:hypothetical protein
MDDPHLHTDYDSMGQWLLNNAAKKGTPEFTEMANAYKEVRNRVEALKDPESWSNTIGRIGSNALTMVPDTLLSIANMKSPAERIAEAVTGQSIPKYQYPMLGPKLRAANNIAELPEDASTFRKIGESAAAGLPFGAAGAVRAGLAEGVGAGVGNLVRSTVTPAVKGYVGSEVGGAIGGEEGATIGGLIGGVAPSIGNIRQMGYARRGAPNAAETMAQADRLGIRPTAGMLGDDVIQARERLYANQGGPNSFTQNLRNDTQRNVLNSATDTAGQRGATGATAPATGEMISQIASDVTGREQAGSSARQQVLMDRIGPRTDTDVAPVLAQMDDIRNRTDPGTFRPIDRRIEDLRAMLPRDELGNVTSTRAPYEQVKDWRTNLRTHSQNADPVPGRYVGEINDATTAAMQDAATSSGVPVQDFRNVQARTRAVEGPGGVVETLEPMAGREGSTAYNYLLPGGESNPARLRSFQALAGSDPRTPQVFGNYMQHTVGETLGNQMAPSSRQFANRVQSMDPEAARIIMGPQEQAFRDAAGLARAFDYRTNANGLGRTTGGLTGGLGKAYMLGEVGSAIGSVFGNSGERAGRAIAMAAPTAIRAIRERLMQGEVARRGFTGQPLSGQPTSINDLLARISAAQASSQQVPQ